MSNVPKTMRAAVVRELGAPLTIEEMPVPKPGYGQVLVQIVASGVCHTDLHAARGDWPVKPNLPLIPGHEGVGIVAAVGEGVTVVREGDRVGVPWLHSACGACECCVTGWETLCGAAAYTGYTVSGGFAEYTLAEASHAGHIPDGLDLFSAAPILCAGVTTYKGLKETEAKPGEWVAISGIGGLGHLAVQYAKAMGLRVVAVDIADDKLTLARQSGADATVNVATEANPVAAVESVTGGGAQGVLITAPAVSAFRQGIAMTRRRGTCVLVGLPPGDFPTPIFEVVLKRITVRGSLVGTRQDLTEALRFAAEGAIRPRIERQPLEAINTVFDRLQSGTVEGRIVLEL
jgi:alcohol dehydrogenase, propanol-preferring